MTENTVLVNGNIYGKWINNRTPELLNAKDHISYINGYPDETVRPENNITREEAAAIICRLMTDTAKKDFSGKEAVFSDMKKDSWSYDSVSAIAAAGLISGYEDNSFRPEQLISRAEAIAIINRMLVRYANKDGVGSYTNAWSDNNEDKWYYYAVIEATNVHEYDRAEDQYNENWN